MGFWKEHVPRGHATKLPGASPPPPRSPRPFWGTGSSKATSQGVVSVGPIRGSQGEAGTARHRRGGQLIFFQTGWSAMSPSALSSAVSRFPFILPQRSGQARSAGLSVYQVGLCSAGGRADLVRVCTCMWSFPEQLACPAPVALSCRAST